jgi:hypothetical protein
MAASQSLEQQTRLFGWRFGQESVTVTPNPDKPEKI